MVIIIYSALILQIQKNEKVYVALTFIGLNVMYKRKKEKPPSFPLSLNSYVQLNKYQILKSYSEYLILLNTSLPIIVQIVITQLNFNFNLCPYYTVRFFHSKSPTWSPIWASWVGDQIDHKSARVIAQIGLFLPQPGGYRSDQKLAGNI